ncbi:MAG: MFS transporter [Verrucomicrobia bacterium]|nr:MFS transporter [Verrucomicrobiota bacterium]
MTAPQSPLTALQTQKAMRLNVLASAFDAVFLALVTGTFLTGYALLLGAGDVAIGWLSAFPLITLPAAAIAAYIADRCRARKLLWLISSWAVRATIVLYILAPLVVPKEHQDALLGILLAAVFFNSIFMAASGPVWTAWMSDIIPSHVEGAFWGRRNSVVNLSLLVASVGASVFIDWLGRDRLGGFIALFGTAVLFGTAMTLIHYRIPEPRYVGPERSPGLLHMFAAPFRHGVFVRYLIFSSAFNLAVWVMVPFIVVFFLKELELSYTWIAVISGINILGSVLSSKFWGYLVDRFGPKPVLSLCIYLKPLAPLTLIFTTRDNYMYVLTSLWFFDGILNAATMVATIPLSIGLGPREQRSGYLAVLNAVVGLAAAAGAIVGGYFLKATEGFQGSLVVPISNYKLVFLLSAVLRVGVMPLLNIVRDRKGAPTGAFLRQFVAGNPFRVVRYSQLLAHSPDEGERVKATRALADTGSTIATRELVNALDDPSLVVREEAAAALGEIADAAAIEALVEKMRSPESKIQTQSARALGKIPHRRSVEALIETLPTLDRALKKDIVRALGEIGDPSASAHLLQVLAVEKDPATLETVVEALAQIGEIQAIHYLLPQLRQSKNEIVKRQLANALGNLLGTEGEFYSVLTRELAVEGQEVERDVRAWRRELNKRYPSVIQRNTEDAVREKLRLVTMSACLGEALDHYVARRWTQAVERLEAAAMLLLRVVDAPRSIEKGFDTESARPQFVERIKALSERSPRRGADYWYIYVLTSGLYSTENPVAPAEALLAFYAFRYAFFEELTGGPPPGARAGRTRRGPSWPNARS